MSAVAAVAVQPAGAAPIRSWVEISRRAPALAATMSAYLEGLSGRLQPRSAEAAESVPAPVRRVCDRHRPQVPLGGGRHRRSGDRLGAALAARSEAGGAKADGVGQVHRLQAGHHSPVLRTAPRHGVIPTARRRMPIADSSSAAAPEEACGQAARPRPPGHPGQPRSSRPAGRSRSSSPGSRSPPGPRSWRPPCAPTWSS